MICNNLWITKYYKIYYNAFYIIIFSQYILTMQLQRFVSELGTLFFFYPSVPMDIQFAAFGRQ